METPKLVLEAFESGHTVESVIIPSDVHPDPDIAEACESSHTKLFALDADAFAKLSDAKTPQPALAVVEAPSLELGERFEGLTGLVVVLVEVADPGNVGTLIRTAEASGCVGVIVTAGTADVLSPKVVRASSGSMLRVPIAEVPLDDLTATLRGLDVQTIATAIDGEPYTGFTVEAGRLSALLLGSEAHGLDSEIASSAEATVSIPMHGRVESLNVATAGAVLAFALTS